MSTSRTELLDSVLHKNTLRIGAGIASGITAGLLLLLLTMVCPPAGMVKLWWIQFMATSVLGPQALAFDAATSVYVTGLIVHFTFSIIFGFIMGKLTLTRDIGRLVFYGFVLGGLIWLATNMFGPNIFNRIALREIGQWLRFFYYMTFGISLGLILAVISRVLKA